MAVTFMAVTFMAVTFMVVVTNQAVGKSAALWSKSAQCPLICLVLSRCVSPLLSDQDLPVSNGGDTSIVSAPPPQNIPNGVQIFSISRVFSDRCAFRMRMRAMI